MMPITGLPVPHSATNAVGMSATPSRIAEARLPQLLHEQGRALGLLEPGLGKLPDLTGHVTEVRGVGLHSRENGRRRRARPDRPWW